MRAYGSLFTILLFVALIIEIVIFAPKETGHNSSQPPTAPTKVQSNDESEQWIEGVHLIETSDGKKEWELKADRALSMKNSGTWIMKRVDARFFGSEGDSSYFDVQGNEGHVHAATKNMSVKGQVIVKSSNGYVFKTNSVFYESGTKKLQSSDPVQMISLPDQDGGGIDLNGVGLSASIDDQVMDVLSQVKLERTLTDGRKVVIRSESARFFSKNRSGEFYGKVIVDIGATRITGPVAKFLYDSNKKALSSMEVEGGVNMTDSEKWATAKKIEMSFLNDEFVLKGSPKMMQNSEELVGEEIRFFDGGRKVQVKGGRAVIDSSILEQK